MIFDNDDTNSDNNGDINNNNCDNDSTKNNDKDCNNTKCIEMTDHPYRLNQTVRLGKLN